MTRRGIEGEGGIFHDGERRMQALAGSGEQADDNGSIVAAAIVEGARPFLARQPLLAIATVDDAGQPWASLLLGAPGFVRALSGRRVGIELAGAHAPVGDPALDRLLPGAEVGLLAIELSSRRRFRINGAVAERTAERVVVDVREAFPNCPKYIQRRQVGPAAVPGGDGPVAGTTAGATLDAERRARVAAADTVFVASRHPQRGLDASHRGGTPGFVRVVDEGTLRIPDYPGNGMFQTLGNLLVEPRVGLAIVDFGASRVLSVIGRVTVRTGLPEDPGDVATGGTGRAWDVAIERFIDRPASLSLDWKLVEPSPFNP